MKYPVQLEALPVTRSITLLRATCTQRLPEIQFGQKTGTTTNCYLVKGSNGAAEVIIDVPSKSYDYDLAAWLSDLGALQTLHTIIITRLNPERLPPLKRLLAAAPGPLRLLASNPALQLLKERAEADAELAQLLERVETAAITRGTDVQLVSGGNRLSFIPVPTPRWPDLAAVYFEQDKVLFSSSFFAAHIAPQHAQQPTSSDGDSDSSAGDCFDHGGWEVYGDAWRYYFDCMLAPAARQAATALERMRINAVQAKGDAGALDAVLGPLRALGAFVTDLTLGADDGQAQPLEVQVRESREGGRDG